MWKSELWGGTWRDRLRRKSNLGWTELRLSPGRSFPALRKAQRAEGLGEAWILGSPLPCAARWCPHVPGVTSRRVRGTCVTGFPQALQCDASLLAQVKFEMTNMDMKLGKTLKLKGKIADNVDG